jgi:hypothetical protein
MDISDRLFSLPSMGAVPSDFNFSYYFKRNPTGCPAVFKAGSHAVFWFFQGLYGILIRQDPKSPRLVTEKKMNIERLSSNFEWE